MFIPGWTTLKARLYQISFICMVALAVFVGLFVTKTPPITAEEGAPSCEADVAWLLGASALVIPWMNFLGLLVMFPRPPLPPRAHIPDFGGFSSIVERKIHMQNWGA